MKPIAGGLRVRAVEADRGELESGPRLCQVIEELSSLGSEEQSVTVRRTNLASESVSVVLEELSRLRRDLNFLQLRMSELDKGLLDHSGANKAMADALGSFRSETQRNLADLERKWAGLRLEPQLEAFDRSLKEGAERAAKERYEVSHRLDYIERLLKEQGERMARDAKEARPNVLDKLNGLEGRLDKQAEGLRAVTADLRGIIESDGARKDAHKAHIDDLERFKRSHNSLQGDLENLRRSHRAHVEALEAKGHKEQGLPREGLEIMAEVLGIPVDQLLNGSRAIIGKSTIDRAPDNSILSRIRDLQYGRDRGQEEIESLRRALQNTAGSHQTLARFVGPPEDKPLDLGLGDGVGGPLQADRWLGRPANPPFVEDSGLQVPSRLLSSPRTLTLRIEELERALGMTAKRTEKELDEIRLALRNAVDLYQAGVRPDQFDRLKECVDKVMNLLFNSAQTHAQEMLALKHANS